MEYLGEIIALGVDGIIFGICLKQYYHCKNALTAVKGAEFYDVGTDLGKILDNTSGQKLDYVAIRGIVKPLGEPLYSVKNKDLAGVVQKLSVKEHVVARTTTGFWSDQERTIQEVYNNVPFVLRHGTYNVEVVDALAAEILDMDTISDHFEPSVPTFTDHLWGFFTGVRQRGLQSTEEMLRDGAIITGIGELSKTVARSGGIRLQPPLNGTPYYLTSMSVTSLLRKLDDRKKTYWWLCVMFGGIGLLISGIVVRRYWKDREEERLAKELRESLAASRKERRQRVRDKDLREDQICVVCRSNPKEIILLPCGHVCLCEDCAEGIITQCPVCRTTISQKNPAYFI
ncbi:mitochondrial E3 ubiquitin protein ligase 1 [Neodiprion pinetum]|uniref:mitochondrial E3 ubiquitin protein ligase 1 n=1 Tax=Neodiprion pinetum TaxID=441929 RepID=UPI001EDF6ECC|nr:mitochondrial E3 ubiquitin protein ligase 1 [Neodiprion pinetum]